MSRVQQIKLKLSAGGLSWWSQLTVRAALVWFQTQYKRPIFSNTVHKITLGTHIGTTTPLLQVSTLYSR